MSPNFTSEVIKDYITDPAFRIPTTAAEFGSSLFAVNARFDVAPPGTPNSFEFEVVRVDR